MNAAGHLAPEIVFGYDRGLLTPDEVRAVHIHIAECAACREMLARAVDADGAARELRRELEAERAGAWKFAPWAVAAAVLLAAGIWGWQRRAAGPEAAPAIADVRLPAFLAELNPPPQVLMGGGKPTAALIFSPRGTAVLTARPLFRWTPTQNGARYRVRVYEDGELAAESPELAAPEWTLDGDLKRGVTYEWQVLEIAGPKRHILPEPPATPPRFRVVESAVADKLHEPGERSHLTMAAEFARAGLIEDAQRELAAARAETPSGEGAASQIRALAELLRPFE